MRFTQLAFTLSAVATCFIQGVASRSNSYQELDSRDYLPERLEAHLFPDPTYDLRRFSTRDLIDLLDSRQKTLKLPVGRLVVTEAGVVPKPLQLEMKYTVFDVKKAIANTVEGARFDEIHIFKGDSGSLSNMAEITANAKYTYFIGPKSPPSAPAQ